MHALLTLAAVWGIAVAQAGDAAAPAAGDATFRVPENSPPGTVVGTLTAAGEQPRFERIDGRDSTPADSSPDAPEPVFAIDPASGQITTTSAAALDFERRPEFTLSVRITTTADQAEEDPLWKSFAEKLGEDEFGGGATENVIEQTVRIVVVDVNEAPVIADASFAAGKARAEPLLGTLAASDPDAGDAWSFELMTGNDAGAFQLEAATGRLIWDPRQLARLEGPTAILGVRVTDRAGLSDTATLTITLPERPAPSVVTVTDSGPPVEAPRPNVVQVVTTQHPPVGTDVTPPSTGTDSGTPPQTSGTAPVQTGPAPRAWWEFWRAPRGVSPLVVGVLLLLGMVGHVLRVRALQRRLAGRSRAATDRAPVPVAEAGSLAAAHQNFEQACRELADDCARLDADRAQLSEERRQLELDREALAARHEELVAAEAQLHERRAELEDECRRFAEEQARSAEGQPRAGRGEDVYAVDDDRAPRFAGHDPAGSTWVDSNETVDGDDPELTALRAGLADMFDITDPHARPVEGAPAGRPVPPGTPPEPLVPVTDVSAGSRDSLYRRRPTPAGEPAVPDDGEDPISSYMDALLKRLRQNGPDATDASPSAGASTRPADPWQVPARAPAAGTPAPTTAAATEPAAVERAPREAPPRPRQDKAVVRGTVDSLREVANLSARSAVAAHVRRKRMRRGLLVGLVNVALLALGMALLRGWLGRAISNTALHWLLLGAGAVVLVHYLWIVFLADRRRLVRELHVGPARSREQRSNSSGSDDVTALVKDDQGQEPERTARTADRKARTPSAVDDEEACVTPAARG